MTFVWIGDDENDGWMDTSFSDTCQKSSMRWWRISTNIKTGERYGMLFRSKDPDDSFDFEVCLPQKMIKTIMSFL